ncbi:hypothetical protein [Saliphagus sp. LR7]|uniref:DUF7344 domain-containing protein n=1 Tax=Saliphagus sp. LR7 TaxID=2282654 RepID=UPI000DF74B9C|nr:hypothetical protein [Saliphagus sp. LR7]
MGSTATPIDVERFRDRTGIGTDDAYRLLADSRVRTTLLVLRENEVVGIDRLVEAVFRVESTVRADVVRIELVHVTLPKLEEYGLLDRERDDGRLVVERGLSAEAFAAAVVTADRA